MKLTEQQKSFFMDMETTLNSPGWARLQEGWRAEQNMLHEATFFNAKDTRLWRYIFVGIDH